MYYYCYYFTDKDLLSTIYSQTVSYTTTIEDGRRNYYCYVAKHNSDVYHIMIIV